MAMWAEGSQRKGQNPTKFQPAIPVQDVRRLHGTEYNHSTQKLKTLHQVVKVKDGLRNNGRGSTSSVPNTQVLSQVAPAHLDRSKTQVAWGCSALRSPDREQAELGQNPSAKR
jgi:hypothetical protein